MDKQNEQEIKWTDIRKYIINACLHYMGIKRKTKFKITSNVQGTTLTIDVKLKSIKKSKK